MGWPVVAALYKWRRSRVLRDENLRTVSGWEQSSTK